MHVTTYNGHHGHRGARGGVLTFLVGAALLVSACTATTDTASIPNGESSTIVDTPAPQAEAPEVSVPASESTPSPTTTTAPTTTIAPTTTAAPTTTTTPTTTTAPTTSTTEVLDVFDTACVRRVDTASSMERLAAAVAPETDVTDFWAENGFADVMQAGALLDMCVNNGINDVDGSPRPVFDGAARTNALTANVERQQVKLNELFAGKGTGDLAVDGDSGLRTGQRLCGARLALGLDTSIADMSPGSEEQAVLFAATELPTPASTATASERWVLIDRTCQMMFIGSGDATTFVFPTSTGSDGFETRDQDRADAFRFNPALDNGGWHNSSEFPVGVDNPLNGNLYKPLYFDLGQAIHGANNVPPTPQSKGCARLRIGDQETLLGWLGLDDVDGELWRKSEMNVTINVQGDFVPRT